MQLPSFILLFLLFSRSDALSHHPATAAAPAPATHAAPADAPRPNIIALMSKKGCKAFADLLTDGAGDAAKSFSDSIDGGLTVFCPNDDAVKPFLPKFKNLTADGKASLLLYHGVPVYYSLESLKSSNGVMNTLATDGVAKNYNFTVQNSGELVQIKSAGDVASIKGTVVDKDPLAIYSIDRVLEPLELFKPAEVPVPAPAPEKEADAPEAGNGGKKKKKKHAAPEPAGPEGELADENFGGRVKARRWLAAAVVAVAVVV